MSIVNRRQILLGVAATSVLSTLAGTAGAGTEQKRIADLKPGQFTWHPERSPAGPVAIIVSIPDQRVHVYRNGIRIGVSTCSTGAPGHATPTGVFTILQKDKQHRSSTYNNAPMPNMNRLTWQGIAIHAGNLPGYPASHGCIRLPLRFSELLFGLTHVGTPVILAGSHTDPAEVVHPGLVLGDYASRELSSAGPRLKPKADPWAADVTSDGGTTAIIVSHGDMTISVLQEGVLVAQGPATIAHPEVPLGRHVFMLTAASEDGNGLTWHALSHHDAASEDLGAPDDAVLRRIKAGASVREAINARMHPGMVLVTTELPAHPDTRTGEDFVLIDTDTST
jgi:hypothetical protein